MAHRAGIAIREQHSSFSEGFSKLLDDREPAKLEP